MADKLNDPRDAPSYNFDGTYKNDREVIIHAINYLLNHSSAEWVFRMFPNINDNRIRNHIESVLVESNLFQYNKNVTSGSFQLLASTLKRVNEIGIEKMLDEKAVKQNEEQNFEALIKEQVVFEVNKLRKEFKDYPKIESRAKLAVRISVAAILVSIVLQVIEWKCI